MGPTEGDGPVGVVGVVGDDSGVASASLVGPFVENGGSAKGTLFGRLG